MPSDASLEDDEFNIEGGEDGGNTAAFNQEVQVNQAYFYAIHKWKLCRYE